MNFVCESIVAVCDELCVFLSPPLSGVKIEFLVYMLLIVSVQLENDQLLHKIGEETLLETILIHLFQRNWHIHELYCDKFML